MARPALLPLLPFAETHQWDNEVRHPDFFSKDFEDWCDYVAAASARASPGTQTHRLLLHGLPVLGHTQAANRWKGPLFDPERLKTDDGRRELTRLATRYYQVTHDAIRRYDPRHLILGDRYEANAPLATEVVEAAKPTWMCSVFRISRIREHLRTGTRARASRSCGPTAQKTSPPRTPPPARATSATAASGMPRCWGDCARAGVRRRAFVRRLSAQPRPQSRTARRARAPDEENLALIARANRETAEWVKRSSD